MSRLQLSKVQKIEVVEEDECLLNKFKEMMEQVLEENGQKAKHGKSSRSVPPTINGRTTNRLHKSLR